jgi:hypothetical protein
MVNGTKEADFKAQKVALWPAAMAIIFGLMAVHRQDL